MSDDGEVARRAVERATACPGVAGMSRGMFGVAATYLPGGTVDGVMVRDDEVEVHIVARPERPLPEIAEDVRAAVAKEIPGRPVHVYVEDIEPGGDGAEPGRGGTEPGRGSAGSARSGAESGRSGAESGRSGAESRGGGADARGREAEPGSRDAGSGGGSSAARAGREAGEGGARKART
ncbi:Asp23/Gls24 family envelope stress response protein [Bailinhaonella thermotolerans]|uniref:Asp23/Gls24 family envelope stress response protein n=1 Tax=Bailinhaonella thermotolerans TaxID=1070861 RepID=UPI001F5B8082|nr:Asp23/Gls24 family envelope stress response protein [Bailinhaonella thermotolerans]